MNLLTSPLFLCLFTALPIFAAETDIQINDVPRGTQMGSLPAPDGAPGNGRYSPPMPARPNLPTLWIIGDSTVRNGTLGEGPVTAQWGWGAPIVAYFDPAKINVVNRAFGGTSSRTFYNGFFWRDLRTLIKKGDFVLLQFGANDNGGKGGLKGIGPETEDIAKDGKSETVQTFGGYLRQFVKDTREQGGTPIICSLTPRKQWTADGSFQRDNTTHVAWAAAVAKEANVPFVDLYEHIARKYESLGSEKVEALYVPSPKEKLHTGWDGAVINAGCVVAGLKGLKENPLASFLSARAAAIAADGGSSRHVISEHGAVADNATVNTAAIQALIDEVAAKGGGTVVIPAGTFRTGALFFKQGVQLHLEKDAVLKGTTKRNDYQLVATRWEGEEREWISALINFRGLSGVRLTGEGTVDGAGDEWVDQNPPRDETARLPSGGRPRLIAIENARDVLVSGISLKNQASWGLFVLYSEDVRFENLVIRARHDIPSSDGIDIDSCRRVVVTGVDIDVNDDCISIKSGKDEDGLRVNRPAEDIVIEKSHFRYGHGGVAMGSETSGGIRNVEVRDCVMDSDNWAPIRFKSQPSRGGVVENITYRNIQLNGTRKAVEFNLAWRMANSKPPANPLPVVRNIHLINISGTATAVGDITGLEGSPIQGVIFENCNLETTRGLRLAHVEGVNLAGLKARVAEGPVVIRPEASPAR